MIPLLMPSVHDTLRTHPVQVESLSRLPGKDWVEHTKG